MRNILTINIILIHIYICLSFNINKDVEIGDSTDIEFYSDINEIIDEFNYSFVELDEEYKEYEEYDDNEGNEQKNKLFLNSRKRDDNTESESSSESNSESNSASNSESDSESYINIDGIQNIKVSIIIPTHNSEKYIARSIQSALDQTLEEIEIIVVDDGSEDSTRSIIKEFMEKDIRIRPYYIKKNVGVGIARNVGIDRALGEFVGFIDSDDFVDPEWYQYLYENSKDKDLVRGIRVIHNFGDTFNKVPKRPYGCIVPSIIRKKYLDDHKLRFPKFRKMEDSTFDNKLHRLKPRTIRLPDIGIYYHYVKREGSLSNYIIEDKKNDENKNKRREIQNDIKFIPTDNIDIVDFYNNFSKIIIGSVAVLILCFIFFIWKSVKYSKKFSTCDYEKPDDNKEIDIMVENTVYKTEAL